MSVTTCRCAAPALSRPASASRMGNVRVERVSKLLHFGMGHARTSSAMPSARRTAVRVRADGEKKDPLAGYSKCVRLMQPLSHCACIVNFTTRNHQLALRQCAELPRAACVRDGQVDIRLRGEAEAPFRPVRLVFYGFSVVSASIGTTNGRGLSAVHCPNDRRFLTHLAEVS